MEFSMAEVYDSTVKNVKDYISAKDAAANYRRSDEDVDDIVQGFYLYLFDNKKKRNNELKDRLIDRFDLNRVTSSDSKKALFNFIVNHLRNYYRTSMDEDLKHKKCLNSLSSSIKEQQTSYFNGDHIYDNSHEESKRNFCHDLSNSLSKKFVRGLNKLERGAYKFFIEDNLSAQQVAMKLGVQKSTAYNLRNSINFKAQQIMNEY
tara:strand:+ start:4616 stop:5230 length:615 start_codon:yes stop_codon:yes gene_type:complete